VAAAPDHRHLRLGGHREPELERRLLPVAGSSGPCSIEGDLAQRYSERSGVAIDDRRMLYFRLLEMVKGTIIDLAGAYNLAHGGDDLRLLSVARIAAAGQAMMGILEAQLEEFLGSVSDDRVGFRPDSRRGAALVGEPRASAAQ
jgi:hypothetical protein